MGQLPSYLCPLAWQWILLKKFLSVTPATIACAPLPAKSALPAMRVPLARQFLVHCSPFAQKAPLIGVIAQLDSTVPTALQPLHALLDLSAQCAQSLPYYVPPDPTAACLVAALVFSAPQGSWLLKAAQLFAMAFVLLAPFAYALGAPTLVAAHSAPQEHMVRQRVQLSVPLAHWALLGALWQAQTPVPPARTAHLARSVPAS